MWCSLVSNAMCRLEYCQFYGYKCFSTGLNHFDKSATNTRHQGGTCMGMAQVWYVRHTNARPAWQKRGNKVWPECCIVSFNANAPSYQLYSRNSVICSSLYNKCAALVRHKCETSATIGRHKCKTGEGLVWNMCSTRTQHLFEILYDPSAKS